MAKEVEKLKSSNAMKPPQAVVKTKTVQPESVIVTQAPTTPNKQNKQ
jgi:hypothetical protein